MKKREKSIIAIVVIVLTALIALCLVLRPDRGADVASKKAANAFKVNSKGMVGEVYAICPKDIWDGCVGDSLYSIMRTPADMLNQYEPVLTLRNIRPEAVNKVISQHRNILMVEIGPEHEQPAMTARYNVNSTPQIVVTLSGPDEKSLCAYVSDNREQLIKVFLIAERDRDLAAAKRHNESKLMNMIKTQFGLDINIPKGYNLRVQGDNFLWISQEWAVKSQGIVIYDYPYSGKQDFDSINLVARRNEFVARIPGPSEGSFMTTYTEDPAIYPVVTYLDINGRHWARMSGFWEVQNDFMGGPFITYSTLDKSNNRVIAIDLYLYSPKDPKRNFIRQLDHIPYSARLQGDK